jgi:pyruvate/2-oxoglutarate dehydrogenase complex dihydrolipoamide dehydrogenase (E3) component
MSQHFDLIVLGSGSGAREGANRAHAEYGASVALVESTRLGGSCPNVACKPTKTYLVVADLVRDINVVAGKLGIEVGSAAVDLGKVKARKDSLIVSKETWIERLHGAGHELFEGVGFFVSPHEVEVDGRSLSADRILVATGSRTAEPPIEGLAEVGWIDHVSALQLTKLPASLLVVGGGPVGLEFAQMFARFGSRVTLVQQADRIAPRSDETATAELTAALQDEGIEILTNATASRVRRDGDEIVAELDDRELRVTKILVAAGRTPNIEHLCLERAGVEHTRTGIAVDDHLRTTADGVWAAGDVTGVHPFTPVAQYQARIAVDDMFTSNAPAAEYSFLPTSIFTDPELASVGLSEHDAREQGLDVGVAVHPIKHVQRASYKDTKRGLFKLVWEHGSRRLLGIHVVCRNGGDIVQGFHLAMELGATVDDLARSHHCFPTFAEGVKAAAEQSLSPEASPAGAPG